jgi:3-(3-hydroxy-phenyl)propionate hydroxylase
MLLPEEDPALMQREEHVWALLARWLTPKDGELWRASSYRFHALVAERWRLGRVFIAGDAAHQQPPFIGQGMCQGLRDVANLVWKLRAVIAEGADLRLLDSYAQERGQHVRTLTSRIKAIGHMICQRDPVAARARDARLLEEGGGVARTVTRQEIVPPLEVGLIGRSGHEAEGTLFPQPWIGDAQGRHLLDDVAGTGWRLVLDGRRRDPDPSLLGVCASVTSSHVKIVRVRQPDGTRVETRFDALDVVELEAVVANWFDRHRCAAVLVRPDHYVFGVVPLDMLADALATDWHVEASYRVMREEVP